MNSIHALCLNTAIDTRISVSAFSLGAVVRSNSYHEFPAGKAVNNAKAIACMDGEVSLHCLCGETDVSLFGSMPAKISKFIIPVSGATRRNITIVGDRSELICHIQNSGFSANSKDLEKVAEGILSRLLPGDVLLFSGSLPAGISPESVQVFLNSAAKRGALILADVDPVILNQLDCSLLHLVKPNLDELKTLSGCAATDAKEIVAAAVASITSRIIVVSLGEAGALWIDRETKTFIHAFLKVTIPVHGDSVGCGDAMVGAFALALARKQSTREALAAGLYAGFANLFCAEPGVLDMSKFADAQAMEVCFESGSF